MTNTSESHASGPHQLDGMGLWRVRITTIIWFFLIAGCLLALPVLFDATSLLVIVAIIVALLVGALIAWLWRTFAGKDQTSGFLGTWFKVALGLFCALCILTAAPIYYFAIKTAADPAVLPRVTLSRGEKTVIMQGMMHIGTESFYKSVVYDAERALSDGYVLYYEGVQPNPAADQWFSDMLAGGGDLSSNYKTLGEICGLQFQLDYFDLLQKDFTVHPDSHVMADVDTLDMKREYDRLMESDAEFAAAMADGSLVRKKAEDAQSMASAIEWLKSGTEGQRKLAGIFCRYSLNNVGNAENEEQPDQMKKVIRDFRNRALADRIKAAPDDKIYITYGAAHIRSVIDLLQAKNPAWKVESISWMRPIDMPKHLEGTL